MNDYIKPPDKIKEEVSLEFRKTLCLDLKLNKKVKNGITRLNTNNDVIKIIKV